MFLIIGFEFWWTTQAWEVQILKNDDYYIYFIFIEKGVSGKNRDEFIYVFTHVLPGGRNVFIYSYLSFVGTYWTDF